MRRSILAALVAIGLAAVGCVSVLLYVRAADNRVLAGQKAVQVLVTTKKIPAGTTAQAIRAGGYTELVTMPAATIPADALTSLDGTLLALAVTADQQPRQLLLRGAFDVPSIHSGGLGIPDGMFAVSVSMRVPAQVAGYLQPGSWVAVFDTFNVATGKGGNVPAGDGLSTNHDYNQATRLLLPKVQVLAIGGRGTPGAMAGPQPSASSGASQTNGGAGQSESAMALVTVAVNQDQAQRLVHAAQTGNLYLALIGNGSEATPGPGMDNYSLFQ
ncbi:hypothetical protein HC028_11970 [Planosporangium flavigriseum]|uniref:Flp pilus assembly protein RcpC/CpaB domain-containing protein n=1 Tax=Planosporangium flavigriseum TaxID=373681 RepID=A0A8J3LEX4_9ACTN|nr:RcpC/CpaB family pilus assembly protein [Planosporangium flavigriseum]NJC65213.1 hypothetical protein [Planosporangium flavigriseum]GIG71832.1 hypothetical protein Pfl04_02360 [Planosporangium flavigriseum]